MASDASGARPEGPRGTDLASADENGFDWRGWTLVAAIVVAFFAVPVAVLYLPEAQGFIRSIGFTVRDGYLVLPLVPAFGLGVLAVWSAVRSRSS